MLDFLAQYGAQILTALVALGSLVGSVYGILKVFQTGKKVDIVNKTTDEKIQITRDGIVEAFKSAKIPTEWKVTISKQFDEKLTSLRDEVISILKNSETARTGAIIMILKILNYTAASNKLTEDDKTKIADMVKLITDEDATLDITE